MRGDINDTWLYDVYAQHGATQATAISMNVFSITRIGRALDVVVDSSGNAVCRSALDGTDPLCVPYNPWQPNGVTAAQINYLQIPTVTTGLTRERVVNASFTGGK